MVCEVCSFFVGLVAFRGIVLLGAGVVGGACFCVGAAASLWNLFGFSRGSAACVLRGVPRFLRDCAGVVGEVRVFVFWL